MAIVLNAVLPIFALILVGYLCARRGVLGPAATAGLNDFVVWLALPALLFKAMATIRWAELDRPGFVAAFTLPMAVVFLVGLFVSPRARLADRAIEGLDAAYANTGFMGLPLCLAALGPASLVPAAIATILTACVLFAGAIVLIEADLGAAPSRRAAAVTVARALARNPLVVSPFLGLAAALLHTETGIALPDPLLRFVTLLAAAASPCALVTIGLFLAQSATIGESAIMMRLVALKLLAHPALTWLLTVTLFPLPPLWSKTAIVLAALPIGTGPFMLAKRYDRDAAITSRAILVSTVLSVVTVSLLVAVLSG